MSDALEILEEHRRWRARDVRYWRGRWDQVSKEIPDFRAEEFKVERDAPCNPHMKAVVRVPRTRVEQPVPVGVVGNTYTLAQHKEVAEKCFEGVRQVGIRSEGLKCELGLTELGEWMNLRIYFPDKFNHNPHDGESLGLRLECFNSVDGSSRLVLLLGWLRFVCSNGLVIGETKAELKDIHNKNMDLERIPRIVAEGLGFVQQDREQLAEWEKTTLNPKQLVPWCDKILPNHWGKKAACRAFHICESGYDVEYVNPFAEGEPTTKQVKHLQRVPGSPDKSANLYDVSQALSWIASNRQNTDERVEWQSQIPELIDRLAVIGA